MKWVKMYREFYIIDRTVKKSLSLILESTFYLVVFIAVYISRCFSSPPDKGISTIFLHALLYSARADIFNLSSWIYGN